jgi:hypothetical protein
VTQNIRVGEIPVVASAFVCKQPTGSWNVVTPRFR